MKGSQASEEFGLFIIAVMNKSLEQLTVIIQVSFGL